MNCTMCGRTIPPANNLVLRIMEKLSPQRLCRNGDAGQCLLLYLVKKFKDAGYTVEDLRHIKNKMEGDR